ncbi:MAG: class I SAM-dependent methyltransferase [Thermodesulfobacteriota bacterium]
MNPPSQQTDADQAAARNQAYYDGYAATGQGYWKYMAAPRLRRKRILSLVSALSPASVCDFGCGDGALLHTIQKRRPDVRLCGVDLSPAQVEKNSTVHPEIAWVSADASLPGLARRLPFSPELAISSEVIEHLTRPGDYLENIREALRPQGALILSTQSGRVGETERYVGHVRHYEGHEIADLLRRAGFSRVRAWNEGWPFHDLSKRLANIRPDRAISAFDSANYGPAQLAVCYALRILFLFNLKTRGAQAFALAFK